MAAMGLSGLHSLVKALCVGVLCAAGPGVALVVFAIWGLVYQTKVRLAIAPRAPRSCAADPVCPLARHVSAAARRLHSAP